MKSYIMLCFCICLVFLFSGCSNQQLVDKEIEIMEYNLKVDAVNDSYNLSVSNIETFNKIFIDNLYDFTNDYDINFSEIENMSYDVEMDLLFSIYKSKVIQQVKRDLRDGKILSIEEEQKYILNNREEYILLDNESGQVISIYFFKYSQGKTMELKTVWYDGVIILSELNEV